MTTILRPGSQRILLVARFAKLLSTATVIEAAPKSLLQRCKSVLAKHFPGSHPFDARLVNSFTKTLALHGITPRNSLLGVSLCCDEITSNVGNELAAQWKNSYFNLGGLAGFPFASKTGFAAFSHHVHEDHNLVVVYGPHVGVSLHSCKVGRVNRENMPLEIETTACGAAIGAFKALQQNPATTIDPHDDYQQHRIMEIVRKNWEKLHKHDEPMVALPAVMYEAIRKEIFRILPQGFHGNIALFGGVQLHTPSGTHDLFQVKHFELFSPRTGLRKDIKCAFLSDIAK